MTIVKCKCGSASMKYEIIGVDLWRAEAFNTTIFKDEYTNMCICRECGETYDNYDPFMVKYVKDVNKMAE